MAGPSAIAYCPYLIYIIFCIITFAGIPFGKFYHYFLVPKKSRLTIPKYTSAFPKPGACYWKR
jgi:hypothetical protein